MTPAARQRWSIGAIVGIIVGELILITGDRSGNHGIRLLGALIMAGRLSVCRDAAGAKLLVMARPRTSRVVP